MTTKDHHHSTHQATKVMRLREVTLKVSPDMVRCRVKCQARCQVRCLVRCQVRCQVNINNSHRAATQLREVTACQVSQEPCQECLAHHLVKCHQVMANKFQVINNRFLITNKSDLVG